MPRNEPSALQLVLDEVRTFRREYREDREADRDDKVETDRRISNLEDDVKGAKLVGRVGLGVAVALGGFITWAMNAAASVKSLLVGSSH